MKKILIYEVTSNGYKMIESGCDKVDISEIVTKICIFADKITCVMQSPTSNLKIYTGEYWLSYDNVSKDHGSKAIDQIIDFIDDTASPHETLYLVNNISDGSILNIETRL